MLTKLKSKQGSFIALITLIALLGLTVFIFSGCAETIDTEPDAGIGIAGEQLLEAEVELKTETIEETDETDEDANIEAVALSRMPDELLSLEADIYGETAEEVETFEEIEEPEEITGLKAEEAEITESVEAIEIMATVAAAAMASVREEPPAVPQNQNITTPVASIGTPTSLADRGYVVFSDRDTVRTLDMRQKSDITEEALREYLIRFPNISGLYSILIEVQDAYSVNAIMLLAIIRLESGNGQSRIAVSKNNLGGIVAPANSAAVHRSFDSQEDCVIFMARLLANQYLTSTGRFFNGYTLVDINRRYSVSGDWSTKVGNLMVEIQSALDNITQRLG